jgi:tetratricopeptide (TPR) repeat protein
MSFAGWNQEATSQTSPRKPERKNRGPLLALSAAGMFGLMWLSRRMFPDARHLPPEFGGRLHAIWPSFAVFAAGLFCIFSTAFLFKGWETDAAQRRAEETGEQSPARAKLSKRSRALLMAAYVLAGSVMMSVPYVAVLWPAHARTIGLAGVLGFAAIVLLGMLMGHFGRKTYIARGIDDVGRQREPWTISTPVLVVAALALSIAAIFGAHFLAKRFAPAHERTMVGIAIGLMACAFGFFMEVLNAQKPAPAAQGLQTASAEDAETRAASQRKSRKKAAVWIFEIIVVLILASPIPERVKEAVFYGHFALLFLGILALRRLRFWIYTVGHRGEFDRALRLNRIAMQIPGYGGSLEGPILFNAGRYHEAQAFLKPLAFDAKGQPRLKSLELYTYALALVNDGQLEEAQKLLEAAVYESPQSDPLKVALASCLLTQEKETDRACRLLEEAMGVHTSRMPSQMKRADEARRTARYAWALASSGRHDEASAKIQQALAEGAGLKDADLAGVHYFVGEAWRVLGNSAEARSAYDKALQLAPSGVAALSAQKGLAKLNSEWPAWKPQS